VVKELQRLERAAKGGAEARQSARRRGRGAWLLDLLADVSQKKRGGITAETRLEELGFDSLMFTELAVALEPPRQPPDPAELTGLETVADVEKLVARQGAKARSEKPSASASARRRKPRRSRTTTSTSAAARQPRAQRVRGGMRALYERVLETNIYGGGQVRRSAATSSRRTTRATSIPASSSTLSASRARRWSRSRKDYFFEDPVRRMYFENFTNLVPMERHGSLRESLRLAGNVIRDGYILLIFPEGTRSETGVMSDFKPSLATSR